MRLPHIARTIMSVPWLRLLVAVVGLSGVAASGCASSEKTEETEAAPAEERDAGPTLAAQDEDIQTVQVYRTGDETNLPVVALGESESLTLAFDVMAEQGRPLSISFQHADRTWTRDLSPNQILGAYQDDRLTDYRSSQGTTVPYVHYTYQFPNADIRFRVSGNYILRVTEPGRPDSVLFERPFFLSDQTGQLRAQGEALTRPGQQRPTIRPEVRYEPPSALRGNTFGYTACFVRNGRLSDTRCRDRPQLAESPQVGFELRRDRSFAPTTADYTVDLSDLRSGSSIERTDRAASPIEVLLQPDDPQFGGGDLDASLNGQTVVKGAVENRANPALTAEYVEATFAFVPPGEQPLRNLVLTGSFSGMDPAQGKTMQWRPVRERYERTMLLKQGRYQYFYQSTDDRLRRAVRNAQSRFRNTYTTFLYYRDATIGSDRLLRVGTFER